MKILLPRSTPLHPDLPDDVTAVFIDDDHVPDEHSDAEAIVTWGGSRSAASRVIESLPRLRWIQALAAGPDALLTAQPPEHVRITTGTGLHDRTVSEHAIYLALTLITCGRAAAAAQAEHRWATELTGPRVLQPAERVGSLVDARVLIWGFGSIGQHLAGVVQAIGARSVRGVARSAGERAGVEVITEEALEAALAETDVLFMVLPHSPQTDKALNARRLAALPARAIVVNVGRGSTVDEEALDEALRAGRVSGAGLDVFAREPLPADSPLWDAPNVVLTPHVAGYRADRGGELIAHNVRAFLAGESMQNEVER